MVPIEVQEIIVDLFLDIYCKANKIKIGVN